MFRIYSYNKSIIKIINNIRKALRQRNEGDYMKNEVAVVIDEQKRDKFITTIKNADEALTKNFKRDTWKVAEAFHKVINDGDFDQAFESLSDLGDAVGYTKTNISRFSRSVELVKLCKGTADIDLKKDYAVTQVAEMLPLYRCINNMPDEESNFDLFLSFLSGITPKMTRKELAAEVKNYMISIGMKEEKKEEEEEVEKPEIENEDTVETYENPESGYTSIAIGDVVFRTNNSELVDALLNVCRDFGVEVNA